LIIVKHRFSCFVIMGPPGKYRTPRESFAPGPAYLLGSPVGGLRIPEAFLKLPWFQRFIFIIFIAKGRGK
jgi:hypothetical protein